MLVSERGDGYEYEVGVPEVSTLWGLRITHVDGQGGEKASRPVAIPDGPLGIEKRIGEYLATHDVVAVAGSLWKRTLRLRDGGRIVFDITLEVTDWRCLDCGADMREVDEYYLVHDELWLSVVPEKAGHLCIGCLENRLGRELAARDFAGKGSIRPRMTDRLRNRLSRR